MVALPHWLDPLAVAQHFCAGEASYILLHSSRVDASYASRTILAFGAPNMHSIPAYGTDLQADIHALAYMLRPVSPPASVWEKAWFGYVGYEMRHAFEPSAPTSHSHVTLPVVWLAQFAHVLVFDHGTQTVELHSETPEDVLSRWPLAAETPDAQHLQVTSLHSNMQKNEYLLKVQHIIEDIHAGKYYQANLTRKFYGDLQEKPSPVAAFTALCALSPAPFSALIVAPEFTILSSSPERFLSMDAQGKMLSEPIKGSAPRGKTPDTDARQLANLEQSGKDNAENLMIVDLIRHDLARVCEPGSVRTDAIASARSFANVHHLVSSVRGQKRGDADMAEVLSATFPPGSMTGAPKIAAMQACAKYEGMDRGVYSGALGWFGADGSCDLSVVIRTLVLQENCFEFQVGGGIVADSKPEAEWLETLAKASALAALLGVDIGNL